MERRLDSDDDGTDDVDEDGGQADPSCEGGNGSGGEDLLTLSFHT